MTMYQFSASELEDTSDVVKVAVLQALVADGAIKREFADEWAARHCVKISKKSIWRTLSDKWTKAAEGPGLVFTVVGYK